MSKSIVVTVAGLGLGLVVACSSSSSGTNTSPEGGASSTSSGGSSSGGSGFKDCSGSSSSSKCTEAESKPYADCVLSKCGDTYKTCYGANYQTGSFSGPCGTYITCIQKCGCNDLTCFQACGAPSTECSNCQKPLETCSDSCTVPACATASSSSSTSSSSGGTGKTCADLQTCCDAISDASIKSACQQGHDSASANDVTCNAYYNAYKTYCP